MKSPAFAAALQAFVFDGVSLPALGPNLFVALHSGVPGDDQAVNECKYPGYRRMPLRRGKDWQRDGAKARNLADVLFPACEAKGLEQATHFSIGVSERASIVLHCGELSDPIQISKNTRPLLPATTLAIAER